MLIEILLLVFAAISVFAVESRDLLHAVIIFAAGDALLALIFLLLAAPDIAITQAAVGSALTTFIFVVAIVKTRRSEE